MRVGLAKVKHNKRTKVGGGRNEDRKMEGHEGERASTAEGTVSVFIAAARIYRLNNDCVMESGPPSRPEINVVLVFVRAGNDRFFQEEMEKQVWRVCSIARVSVWKTPQFPCGEVEVWEDERNVFKIKHLLVAASLGLQTSSSSLVTLVWSC